LLFQIQPVFDFFHIIKKQNNRIVREVKKDEYLILLEEGDIKAASFLHIRTPYKRKKKNLKMERLSQKAVLSFTMRKYSENQVMSTNKIN
jgi:hypothetical protein